MCRQQSLTLEPRLTAPREARRFLTSACRQWGIDELVPELELLCSELVTNAALHARTRLEVVLTVTQGGVEVGVRDHDPRHPLPRERRADVLADVDTAAVWSRRLPADHDDRDPALHVGPAGSLAAGRGLHIVEAVSDEWGVAERGDGKEVWFRLSAPPSWPYLDDCRCRQDGQAASSSGRPAVHMPGPWDD